MKYFLVLGNTRVGSSWLSSSFHRLPQVSCTREIRWWMPYQEEANRNHVYVDSTTRSIKERIDFGSAAAPPGKLAVVGAKFKLDPYGFTLPAAFDALQSNIEDDIHLILLRRSYLEIFTTWKAYGIRHLANQTVRHNFEAVVRAGEAKPATVSRFYSMYSTPLEKKNVVLTVDGKVVPRIAGAVAQLGEPETLVFCPIRDAIDDLLVLFFNDVFMLSLAAGRRNARVIDYQEINTRFFDIVRDLGIAASREDCEDVLKTAPTSKMEVAGERLVHPEDALAEISIYLDQVFHNIRKGSLSVDGVVRHDGTKDTVSFNLPQLAVILDRHEETRGFAPSMLAGWKKLLNRWFAGKTFARDGNWLAQRPVYVPESVAPAPSDAAR